MKKTFCTAIVLAAGSGKRMGTKIAKQYLEIDGKPLLYYTLLAFERSPRIDKIILTVGSEEQISYCQETILRPYGFQKVASVITGGKERYDSVWMGLKAVKDDLPKEATEGIVFIHDGARPMVSEDILERCFQDAQKYNACVAAVPVKDTIKIADENGFAETTPRRDRVWQVDVYRSSGETDGGKLPQSESDYTGRSSACRKISAQLKDLDMFFLGREPAVFNKKSAFYKKSKKSEKEC